MSGKATAAGCSNAAGAAAGSGSKFSENKMRLPCSGTQVRGTRLCSNACWGPVQVAEAWRAFRAMTYPADGQPVPATSELLRLPRWPRDFDPARWRPSYEDFQPSSTDKNQAVALGKPVRVSVWDHGLTKVEEARVFRNTPALVVVVENRAIAQIAHQRQLEALRTVYDPLKTPDNERPGAAGHAGIEGLDRGTGLSKLRWRELLDDLAARARLLEPSTSA